MMLFLPLQFEVSLQGRDGDVDVDGEVDGVRRDGVGCRRCTGEMERLVQPEWSIVFVHGSGFDRDALGGESWGSVEVALLVAVLLLAMWLVALLLAMW
jgi:hypothetical protein